MKPEDLQTLAGVLTSLDQRVSMLAAALRGMLDCETLAVETIILPANGIVSRDYKIGYHSVAVTSQSAGGLTLVSSPPAISAPTSGMGVVRIGIAKHGVWNLAGKALTIYGTAGDVLTISVFARPQPPAWGA